MIELKILNRSRKNNVLFVHGVFANSGFWLPYLRGFKNYRLLLLDVNYQGVRNLTQYLQLVEEIIAVKASGQVEAIIGHSLGGLLAGQLPASIRKISYKVCPVYNAVRSDRNSLVINLRQRLKQKFTAQQIRAQLAEVDCALLGLRSLNPDLSDRGLCINYLPNNDPLFNYNTSSASRIFAGDHFNVGAAMDEIGRELSK
jgi:pimeloyl-ACP methyl ester carboxylesterase